LLGSGQHGARRGEIASHRLFGENRLAGLERGNGDLGLQTRQRGDGDRLDVRVFDQSAPVAIGLGDAGCLREFLRARGIAAGQRHHRATRVSAECRHKNRAAVIGADDAEPDHALTSGFSP
jgi:hypothetical protein